MTQSPFAMRGLFATASRFLDDHPTWSMPPHGAYTAQPGQWSGAYVSCARMQAMKAENARLRRLAFTDDLTGAFNRRYFMTLLRSTLYKRPREGGLCMCLIDVDHFKDINDGEGHFVGDDVLRDVSRVAGMLLRRAGDALCRIGGDEFGAVYSADTPTAGLERANAIRLAIKALHVPSRPAGVTVTLGLVWLDPTCAIRADQLYAEADRGLYRAKRGGRDRVVMSVVAP